MHDCGREQNIFSDHYLEFDSKIKKKQHFYYKPSPSRINSFISNYVRDDKFLDIK